MDTHREGRGVYNRGPPRHIFKKVVYNNSIKPKIGPLGDFGKNLSYTLPPRF
jgi:hypothetical protein